MLREKVRWGERVVSFLLQQLPVITASVSAVHGVSDHRQRSGSSAAECCSHPRDGAAVERPAAQSPSHESSVQW